MTIPRRQRAQPERSKVSDPMRDVAWAKAEGTALANAGPKPRTFPVEPFAIWAAVYYPALWAAYVEEYRASRLEAAPLIRANGI